PFEEADVRMLAVLVELSDRLQQRQVLAIDALKDVAESRQHLAQLFPRQPQAVQGFDEWSVVRVPYQRLDEGNDALDVLRGDGFAQLVPMLANRRERLEGFDIVSDLDLSALRRQQVFEGFHSVSPGACLSTALRAACAHDLFRLTKIADYECGQCQGGGRHPPRESRRSKRRAGRDQ